MTSRPSNLEYVAPVFRVADLPRSISYYQNQLGFEVEFNYENFYASVLRDGCRIHLKAAPPPVRNQTEFEAAENLDACFGVQNAQALSSQFALAGAAFSVPLRSMPYGTEFYAKDPDGYILGFIQPSETQSA